MNPDNFVSDVKAAELIQAYGIASSEVTDESGSTVNELGNGDTLYHYADPNKPLGWEHDAVVAEAAPLAPQAEPAAAPEPNPVVPLAGETPQPEPAQGPNPAAEQPLAPAVPATPESQEAPLDPAPDPAPAPEAPAAPTQ